jgi:hypothetical protein
LCFRRATEGFSFSFSFPLTISISSSSDAFRFAEETAAADVGAAEGVG